MSFTKLVPAPSKGEAKTNALLAHPGHIVTGVWPVYGSDPKTYSVRLAAKEEA